MYPAFLALFPHKEAFVLFVMQELVLQAVLSSAPIAQPDNHRSGEDNARIALLVNFPLLVVYAPTVLLASLQTAEVIVLNVKTENYLCLEVLALLVQMDLLPLPLTVLVSNVLEAFVIVLLVN